MRSIGLHVTGGKRGDIGRPPARMERPFLCTVVCRESGTNRGRLRGLVLPVGVGEAGVPVPVVVAGGVVE